MLITNDEEQQQFQVVEQHRRTFSNEEQLQSYIKKIEKSKSEDLRVFIPKPYH